tara:strand:+ start:1417 stop:1605 length:189 start_codon:yes stop_codon:yes gene_type:complete
MLNFNDYNKAKKTAEDKQELYVREEEKLKKLEEETQDTGWDSLEGKPHLVDEYVKHITRNSK